MPDWGEGLVTVYPVLGPVQLAEEFDELLNLATTAAAEHESAFGPFATTTTSPGYLGLRYLDVAGNQHKTKFRLLVGNDPLDYASMITEAARLAPYLGQVVPAELHVEGFFTQDEVGHMLLDSLLPSSVTGSHPSIGIDMRSFSVAITGRSVQISNNELPGNAVMRWFPKRWATPPAQTRGLPLSADVTVLNWAAALATSTVCWADYRGMKASIRPVAPIQANAAVQRRVGW